MKRLLLQILGFCTVLLFPILSYGQTVRGLVIDKSSNAPIMNATLEVLNLSNRIATYSDDVGSFALEGIPLGRQRILVIAEGYEDLVLSNIVVAAGKDITVNAELTEVIKETSKKVTPKKEINTIAILRNDRMQTVNQMATIGTRSFTLEEVNRYAGCLNDPARIASNFAGMANTDDAQNFVSSRGNTPFGNTWYIEGVQMNNPNHFATLGNTGSALPILNTNALGNSDFLTGAFPAEYSGAFSGIFDIHLRNGNDQKYQFNVQFSIFGAALVAEGPFKKGRSSFLITYRYSVFGLFKLIGLDLITGSIPKYQDFSMKLNFKTSKAGTFSLFGIGGLSNIGLLNEEIADDDPFAERNINLYVTAHQGMLGLKHKKFLSGRTFIQTTLHDTYVFYESHRDSIKTNGSLDPYYGVHEIRHIPGISSFINSKLSSKLLFRSGIKGSLYMLDILDQYLDREKIEYESDDYVIDAHAFAEMQYKFNSKLALSLGVSGHYMHLNKNTYGIEPRFALNWQVHPRHKLSLGYGWHSKRVPMIMQFYKELKPNGEYNSSNRDLGFVRSHHGELAYEWQLGKDWRAKSDIYAHYLTNIPIEQTSSSFSLINYGTFTLYPKVTNLKSEGVGLNYGLDLTVEKFFSKGYYGGFTGSVFSSKYQGSDGIWRSTSHDILYTVQLVAGKEFKIGKQKRNAITLDLRVRHHPGRRYIPIMEAESILANTEVLDYDNAYTAQLKPYFRLDFKVGARVNGPKGKISHYFFVDAVNPIMMKNELEKVYNPDQDAIVTKYQMGITPMVFYQLQF
ncbi:MAG: TonB-dependent receptor [Aureispira sp.]|nr:TonB-dependent receptor [Aureispira sp.]